MTSKDLTVIEGSFVELKRDPTEVLDDAKRAAKALTTVIDQKKRKVMIKGQVYLEYEDWQTVAQFYGYSGRTRSAVPVDFNGVKGAKAEADLIDFRTGITVGGAESYCMRDEENWGEKPWFQLASMAQTRAGSKAIRNRMAWVVVLAGYAGTPAEEMIQEKIADKKEREEHWCKLHNVAFFKRGKMKGYAHQMEGGEWCNEPEETPEPQPDAPERVSSPPKQEASSNPPEQEDGYSKQIDKVVGGGDLSLDLSLLKTTTDVMRVIAVDTNGSLQPTDQLNLLREVDPAFTWTGYKGTMLDLYKTILLLAEGEMKE